MLQAARAVITADSPAELRRLMLRIYALVGPFFCASLLLLGRWQDVKAALASVLCLVAAGALWLFVRRSPTLYDWIFPVAVVPTICCGIGFLACDQRGLAYLALVGGPMAWAAVLFEAPIVVAALVVAIGTVFVSLLPRLGFSAAAMSTFVLSPVAGLVAWVIYAAAERLRDMRRQQQHILERDQELLQSVQESEERYRSVVAAMAEGAILRTADEKIAACNGAAARIIGVAPGAMFGNSLVNPAWPMVREDGSPLAAEDHPALATLRTGRPQSNAVIGIRKPSGLMWLSVNTEPLRHGHGLPPYAVVTTFSDVTEAKRQRDLLMDTERRFALVLEGSNDGFWDLDLARSLFTFSDRVFEIVGEHAQGTMYSTRFWWPRVHPDDVAVVRRALDDHVNGRTERIDAEYRLRVSDGTWRWVRAVGKSVEKDAMGRPTRLAGTLRDVTERHDAKARLQEALATNEKLVDELREALQNIKTLSGLIPVCAWCHRIRNDAGYWKKIEDYVSEHTEATFTHGMCPACYERMNENG